MTPKNYDTSTMTDEEIEAMLDEQAELPVNADKFTDDDPASFIEVTYDPTQDHDSTRPR